MEDLYTSQNKIYKTLGGEDVVIEEVESDADEQEEESEDEAATSKTKRVNKIQLQRYKGLGEMNASELWETTMDPNRRVLKRVTVDDGAEADRIFDILMGSDVASRKSFIQSNAKLANLDV